MKVSIIHNQFNRSGGMESYLLSLLDGFISAGDDVHVHAYKVDARLARQFACTVHKTNLFFLPRKLRKYYFLTKYNRGFQKEKYDLSLSLTRTCCQDVAIVGGVHPQSVLLRQKGGWYRSLHDTVENKFEAQMFQRVPHVVAHSKLIKKEITAHYPDAEKKVTVLYPPINEARFMEKQFFNTKSTQPLYSFSESKITLLFPSLSHERKGLAELLAAFEQLDQSRFELIVVGDKRKLSTTKQENIIYLGYVEEMRDLYAAVDYVILPSHYEPFGLVVTEALECRTPVIISKSVGASELVSAGDGIVLEDNQPETLMRAISSLERMNVAPFFSSRNKLLVSDHVEALKQFSR